MFIHDSIGPVRKGIRKQATLGKNDAGARAGAGLDTKLYAMLQLGDKGFYACTTLCSVTRARKTQRLREVK